MSDAEPEIDTLVRAFLNRKAEQVAAEPGLARIRATLAAASKPSRPRISKRWILGATAAAAILLGFLGVHWTRPVQASAEAIVLQAKQVHALPTDRCYLVETRPDEGVTEENSPLRSGPRTGRLWTRGDRFWIESKVGQRSWIWGRDEEGSVWLALSRHRGMRFGANEIPPAVALRCDVLSVRLETLLNDAVLNFDLKRLPGDDPETTIIRVEPRPGRPHPNLREATLEIDSETKVLRKLILFRTLQGHAVTTTFTLVEDATLSDSSYQLEGHLDEPYQIYRDDFEPWRRRQLLLRLFAGRSMESATEDKSRDEMPSATTNQQ